MNHHICITGVTAMICALASCSTIPPAHDPEPESGGPADLAGEYTHDLMNQVHGQFVDTRGRVDYAGLQVDPGALDRYYSLIATHTPDTDPHLFPNEASRLAFWINAYNAAVLKTVITHYPIQSVSDVKPPPLINLLSAQSGFFYFQRLIFGGETMNLYDLEHEIIRGRFPDPRIHFAINCASLGCPKLPQEAFTTDRLDQQLQREATEFLNEERNLRIDDATRTVHLSSILSWYADDFLGWLHLTYPDMTDPTLLDYARLYVSGERRAAVDRAREGGYDVVITPYDWRLNDQAATY
ncbi:MAG: DUF547 domain-containing protein [Gemmatimonadetes bacterium]|nr:DUF547 domain-containing protein [Gemmatimonadota bacterium]MBT6149963.1 DUF547 domain-containing protein [Gemmatimonadota bacterium]MBT7861397.1 DUF547 domain-containing protein [Gemmatimonadota bacterium]